jgi:hypothetical protein
MILYGTREAKRVVSNPLRPIYEMINIFVIYNNLESS